MQALTPPLVLFTFTVGACACASSRAEAWRFMAKAARFAAAFLAVVVTDFLALDWILLVVSGVLTVDDRID